jgi:tripartite-type tricarboxylate transporter receptor subunit TctC
MTGVGHERSPHTTRSPEAKSLAELVAWLRANPGKAVRGTGGAGSLTNIAGLSFAQRTGTHFRSVPYRGASAATNDLLAGHIDFMIDLAPNSLAHVRAGAIKGYAVLAATRMAAVPDLPTVDDAGLPGFHMSAWQAVWAPKNTPPAVLGLLNTAIVDALADSTVQARLAQLGQATFPPDQQSAAALGAWQKAEIDRWWPIIKATGIQGDERRRTRHLAATSTRPSTNRAPGGPRTLRRLQARRIF